MRKVKVGILTFSNTTQILDCPVSACIKDLNERKGAFADYKESEVELIGVILSRCYKTGIRRLFLTHE